MQLTLNGTRPTPHGTSRLVQSMCVWSVKTRRAPSQHCGDARIYSRTSTAMHDNKYAPHPPVRISQSAATSCPTSILLVRSRFVMQRDNG